MKKKFLFFVCMIFAMLTLVATVSAQEIAGEVDISYSGKGQVIATFYYTEDGGYSLVVSGDGRMRTSGVGNMISAYKEKLESVVIEEGVLNVCSGMFERAYALKTVELSKTVCEIGNSAFNECQSLQSINIPVQVGKLEYRTFNNCRSLMSVDIQGELTYIGDSAFSNCASLAEIYLSDSITQFGNSAFSGCTSLKSVVVPRETTVVSSSLFANCSMLFNVTLHENINTISQNAFSGCTSLEGIYIPESVYEIGAYAFRACRKLTIYAQAKEAKEGWNASWNPDNRPVLYGSGHQHSYNKTVITECSHFTDGEIYCSCECGHSYTEIIPMIPHNYAETIIKAPTHLSNGEARYTCSCGDSYEKVLPKFYSHEYVETVTKAATHFESGVKTFACECGDSYAQIIPQIEHVFVDGVCECGETIGIDPIKSWVVSASGYDDVVAYLYYDIYNPGYYRIEVKGQGRFWWNRLPLSQYRNFITEVVIDVEGGEYELPPRALENFTELRRVVLGEGLVVIRNNAFRMCRKLEEVSLPQSLKRIESGAFERCEMLAKITGLDNIDFLGANAFRGCYSLQSIVLGPELHEIQPMAFEECRSLEMVIILGDIVRIPDRAFRNCTSLYCVVINNHYPLEQIGKSAFENCQNLKICSIQEGAYEVKAYAFANCRCLIGIDLGQSVKSIEDYAFRSCISLRELMVTPALYYVGKEAFSGCGALSFYVPETVETMIDWQIFGRPVYYGCKHVHGEHGGKCSHAHIDNSNEYDFIKASHYSFGVHVVMCTCGASYVSVTDRIEEHEYSYFEKYNKTTHIGHCGCGKTIALEHNFVNSICVDCGYERKNVLELEDVIYKGISTNDPNIGEEDWIEANTGAIFDGETSPESGASYLGNLNKISMGFSFKVSTAGINGIIIYTNAMFDIVDCEYITVGYGNDSQKFLQVKLSFDIADRTDKIRPFFIEITGEESFQEIQIVIDNNSAEYGEKELLQISEIQFSLGIRNLNVEQDGETGDITVSKDDELTDEENSITITLQPGDVEWIKGTSSGGNGKLRVETKFGDVVFNRRALEKICAAAKGITVTITRSVDIRGRVKYSISVCDQNGEALLPPETSDENGTITVHIKYKSGKDSVNLKVEFHGKNDSGHDYVEEKDINSYDSRSGMISFNTEHFSDYIIYDPNEDMSGIVQDLFKSKGYSRNEFTNAICIGFDVNYEIVSTYNEIMGTELDFGVVFASEKLLDGKLPLDENGNAIVLDVGMVAKMCLAGKSYKSYELVLGDLTADLQEHSFVLAGYAVTNGGVVYYQEGGMSTEVGGVTYKELAEEGGEE